MVDAVGRRRIALAACFDVDVIVLFVIIGRRSHDEGSAISGVVKIAAPFLLSLALGWLASRAWESPREAIPTGVVIWLVTVIVGLTLRRFAFGGGTALPFVIVTTLFLLAGLVGWRAVAEWRESRRSPTA